jgi:hypothetical protein
MLSEEGTQKVSVELEADYNKMLATTTESVAKLDTLETIIQH